MNVLVLAAGAEPVRDDGGYPLCLAEFGDRPLIEALIGRCRALAPSRLIVAVRQADVDAFHLDRIVQLIWSQAAVLAVRGETAGAACTALLAAGEIDNDEELLLLSGNEILDLDYREVVDGFRARGLDAGTVTFRSVHPRYGYVKLDAGELVVEASEKRPISTSATAGFYWFARGSDFVRAVKDQIRKDAQAAGAFYVCPAFNELVLRGGRVGVQAIPNAAYHPLKTERQLEHYDSLAAQGA